MRSASIVHLNDFGFIFLIWAVAVDPRLNERLQHFFDLDVVRYQAGPSVLDSLPQVVVEVVQVSYLGTLCLSGFVRLSKQRSIGYLSQFQLPNGASYPYSNFSNFNP